MRKSLYVFWNLLIALSIAGCSKQTYTADIDTSYYRINKKHQSNKELDELIAPYRQKLEAKMNEVIAYNKVEMRKDRPNSTLGNWFSDALLEEAEKIYGKDIDVAMQNYGGLRVPSLKQGNITVGNIYELMPFDNKLVVLTMDGKLLQQLLNRIAEKGGWPISHTLKFSMKRDKAVNAYIKNEALDVNKKYTVAIADYIANGGDNCFFLDKAEREDKDIMIRDLIIDHLRNKPENDRTIIADNTLRIVTQNY
ncbi:MAG: 5'-nucleotidase [Bacteroidota bacterium]